MRKVVCFFLGAISAVFFFIGCSAGLMGRLPEAVADAIIEAIDVSYDNATSGLSGTTVQAAIDELAEAVATNATNITANATNIATNTAAIDALDPGIVFTEDEIVGTYTDGTVIIVISSDGTGSYDDGILIENTFSWSLTSDHVVITWTSGAQLGQEACFDLIREDGVIYLKYNPQIYPES